MPSSNTLWRNSSFQNYADYAATNAFRDGLKELAALARHKRCIIMCAEAGGGAVTAESSPITFSPKEFPWRM